MLSSVLLVCVLSALFVWFKYVRDKLSVELPPPMSGKLPIIGHAYILTKYSTNLQGLVQFAAEDCGRQGGVTYFYFGRELHYWGGPAKPKCSDPLYNRIMAMISTVVVGLVNEYDTDINVINNNIVIEEMPNNTFASVKMIVDPQDALTAANACLTRHYVCNLVKGWVGDGLFISTGDIWKRHRKLLMPAFTLPVVYGFLDVFNIMSKKLASSVEPHVGKGYFDHFPYLKSNALETLCVGTFGINPIDDNEFTQKYMKSVAEMFNIVIHRIIKFWLQNNFIYWVTGLKKKEEEVIKNLHAMANTVLQKKKTSIKNEIFNDDAEAETTGNKYKPFVDLLLELSKNGALTDKEIREETDSIIAAGFETTSNQLTFTLLQLGAHPEVQEKVYKELLEVLGLDRDVEKDDVSKLVYTNAVIMESLRTIPSLPIMLRNVDKDVKLKNYTMPAGSYCVIFPLAISDDASWGAHSDQFRPERWLDGDFRNNKEFAAFGLGKRACIGRTYAMVSMKVTLAHFLRKYRVSADMSRLKKEYEFLMRPASGHEIAIHRRT